MFNSKSILSTVRSLNSDMAEEENSSQSTLSTIAEMDTAISDLNTWRKRRENESNKLLRQMITEEEQKEKKVSNYSSDANNETQIDPTATFLTTHYHSKVTDSELLSNNVDDDPISLAYENRLLSELAALQKKRKKMEEQSNTPRAPICRSMPSELLISESQIKALTEDTRKHIGNKSVQALKHENARLLMENKVREEIGMDGSEIQDADVMKELSAEGSEFENIAGLSNALELFDSQMADLLLKMDVVDEGIERHTPRTSATENEI
jgi:hypothetical protein